MGQILHSGVFSFHFPVFNHWNLQDLGIPYFAFEINLVPRVFEDAVQEVSLGLPTQFFARLGLWE